MASYIRRSSLVQAGKAPTSAEPPAPLQHRHHQHHEYEHRHTRHHMHKPTSHGDDATGSNMDAPKKQLFPQDIIDEIDANDDNSSDDRGSNDNSNSINTDNEDDTPNDLRRRVTEIVQTVSVVQIINTDGSVLELSTAPFPQATTIQPFDKAASLTSDAVSASGASSATAASSASVLSSLSPSSSSAAEAASNSQSSALTVAASATSFANSTTSGISVLSFAGTGSSAATLLPNASNSTLPVQAVHFTTNGTATHRSLFGNATSTRTSSYLSSSLLYSSSTTFSSSLITSSSSAITSSPAAVVVASATAEELGSAAASTTDSTTVIAPTASSADTNSDSTTGPSTSVLVGGVVGGVAGLALLLLAALMFLRWKRRMQHHGHKLLGDGAKGVTTSATRGLIEGGDGAGSGGVGGDGGAGGGNNGGGDGSGSLSGTGGGGGVMAERRTTFLMPFSSFASKRQSRGTGGESSDGESGFYRVSGKKLPSVLMYGGDGYRDPRDSVQSGSSVVFRDSQGFFGGEGGPSTMPTSRYAVGSPMRPESGVLVFQPGPGKTATAMRVPLPGQGSPGYDDNDDHSPNELVPPTRVDPIGRSLSSQDGSRGSGSRFTEEVL